LSLSAKSNQRQEGILDFGEHGLQVTFDTSSRWPTMGKELPKPVDASEFNFLKLRAFNESDKPMKVGVNVKDSHGKCYQRVRLLPPGQWREYRIPIEQLRQGKDEANWWCDSAIDVSQIKEIVFQGHEPTEAFSVRFSSVFLVQTDPLQAPRIQAREKGDGVLLEWTEVERAVSYDIFYFNEFQEAVRLCRFPHNRFVDISIPEGSSRSYCVSAVDFLGRAGLRSEPVTSQKDPNADNGLPDLGSFGGRKDISLGASGYFRTEKVQGRWVLIDPEGHPFFSVGICVLGCGDTYTRVSGREEQFADILKEKDDPRFKEAWEPWYGYAAYGLDETGLVVSPYIRGRILADGKNWMDTWRDRTLSRLKEWHVNTMGAWSHDSLAHANQFPFVTFSAGWGACPTVAGHVPDVFHSDFERYVQEDCARVENLSENPFLLGYFTANEMGWYGDWQQGNDLLALIQMSDNDSPSRQAWLSFLKKRYQDIEAINKAWETQFQDWDALSQWREKPSKSLAARKDRSDFLRILAERYFRVTSHAIRAKDPHHILLGARHSQSSTVEVIQENAMHCEILSATLYGFSPGPELTKASAMTEKPWMVGEFHFMAEDAGLPLRDVQGVLPDQKKRGEAYQNYLSDALSLPNLVGVHWFEYIDQPSTGRFDHGKETGEAHNIGWVDVQDRPYEEFVAAARLMNANIPLLFETPLKPRTHSW